MSDPLRFGVLGCGVIGATHAAAIAGLPGARLVAVADPDPARAAGLEAQYGVAAYTDLREMLDQAQPDVVNICTPSGLHGAQAIEAMRAGRHVLVEKPMDIRRETLDEMLAVQQAAGVQLAVISQHRFDRATLQVRDLIAAGAFGRLALGNACVAWWRSQAYYDSGSWRGTPELDGGVLMNQAIHSIDVLQWLMGPVRSVAAHTETLSHDIRVEDAAVATLRFANGALGTIAATTGAYPGDLTRIEVFGDRGSAVIQNDALAYLRLAGEEPSSAPDAAPATPPAAGGDVAPTPPPGSHAWQIADLMRAIREGGVPAVDGHGGRQPVDIILAIYDSARSGQEVTLP